MGEEQPPPPSCNEGMERECSQAPADLLCSMSGFPAARSVKFARRAVARQHPFTVEDVGIVITKRQLLGKN